MLEIAPGWSLEVERGPGWVFVDLSCLPEHEWECPPLAERIWSLLEQHFCYRVVLDCSRLAALHSWIVGQIVLLHKRVASQGGVLRLCGLSEHNREVLRATRLGDSFPHYCDRTEAVMGQRPSKPR